MKKMLLMQVNWAETRLDFAEAKNMFNEKIPSMQVNWAEARLDFAVAKICLMKRCP